MRPAIEVTQADRELFITLSNADGQMAERILCGQAFTWEVEQIARHRLAERDAVVKWLRICRANKLAHHRSVCHYEDDEILDAIITAADTFGYAADAIEAGEPFK